MYLARSSPTVLTWFMDASEWPATPSLWHTTAAGGVHTIRPLRARPLRATSALRPADPSVGLLFPQVGPGLAAGEHTSSKPTDTQGQPRTLPDAQMSGV